MRRVFASLIAVALAIAMAIICVGCARPDRDHIISSDLAVLRAFTARACQLEYKEIIADVPATPTTRAPAYGLDLLRRAPAHARWPHRTLCRTVKVANEATIDTARRQDGARAWPAFSSRFDGAQTLIRVSLPVYSPDRRRAVIYVATTCPYTCGTGFFHELEKTPTGWQIVASTHLWSL